MILGDVRYWHSSGWLKEADGADAPSVAGDWFPSPRLDDLGNEAEKPPNFKISSSLYRLLSDEHTACRIDGSICLVITGCFLRHDTSSMEGSPRRNLIITKVTFKRAISSAARVGSPFAGIRGRRHDMH